VVVYEKKCIEPVASQNPTWRFTLLAERLGFKDDYTDGGKTEEDWIRTQYDVSDLPKHISYEDFKKKGYLWSPFPKTISPACLPLVYEGRRRDTPDGFAPDPDKEGRSGHVQREDRIRLPEPSETHTEG